MGVFAALDQRIATRYAVKAMDLGESSAYLRHHLALVGRDEPLFADDAVARLHRVSNGLTRPSTTSPPPPSSLPPRAAGPRLHRRPQGVRRRLRQAGGGRDDAGLTMVDRSASESQRIVVDVDVVAGYCVECLGERLRCLVTDELMRLGMDVTRSRIAAPRPHRHLVIAVMSTDRCRTMFTERCREM